MKFARICRHLRAATVVLCVAVIQPTSTLGSGSKEDTVTFGERLVHNLDCNACHTPKALTPQGPTLDLPRLLSGHPADEALPAIPEGLMGPTGWGGAFSRGLTAWVGPWGVSFASNLTPDDDTGIGGWSEDIFVEAMRTGTHQEEARPFLPPMPTYSRLTDGELHAIFAYLRTLRPIHNAVPAAVLPSSSKSGD